MSARHLPVLILFLALGSWAQPGWAENWPRWRGPEGNGVSTESPLPLRWSAKDNIRWKTKISGEGSSSPIVWEERIFLTSAFDKGERRAVHCLDRANGKILWSQEIVHKDPERTSAVTGHAAATPVTDGKRVVAFFGNAGVVCYDFAGKRLWQRGLGEFDSELGLASSPVLYRDRVILVCDHDGDRFTSFDSFLIALDAATGKEVWKTERHDLYRSWSTPILVPAPSPQPSPPRGEGKPSSPSPLGGEGRVRVELIVNAQEQLRAYDPETGKALWHLPGMTDWVTPSPVFGHGLIFATSGRNGPLVAVRPGGKDEVKPIWQHRENGPYVCSPVLYGDYLYVHTEQGILTCYDAKTGKQQYQERLKGKFWASAVAGDGKVFVTNEDGLTFVIKAGPKFEVLARNALEEYGVASPAISGKELFLRTEHHLYCISRDALEGMR